MNKYIFEKDYYDRLYGVYYKEGEIADIISGEVRKDGYYIFPVESKEFNQYGRELTENKRVKGYMASNFFDLGGFEVTDRIANIIEKYGVDLYVPQRNDEINDKEKADPTAIQIWEADINYLKQSDILFAYYDGEDPGVAGEIAYMSALLENTSKKGLIVGIYTDCRQYGVGDGHHYINLFIKGGIEKHGILISSNKWGEIEEGIKKAINEFNNKKYIK